MFHRYDLVRITHLPTGIAAEVEPHRSFVRARQQAMRLLAAKLISGHYGPQKLVRSYEIPDDKDTIPVLEDGSCIGETHVARAK